MLAVWLLKDQEPHAVLNIQRPCCFLSNTAEAAGVWGRLWWVYLEKSSFWVELCTVSIDLHGFLWYVFACL